MKGGLDTDASKTCINESDFSNIVTTSVYFSLVSSILTIFGCLLIILTFFIWKDVRRTGVRIVILFLAFADLGAGIGYFVSSASYLAIYNRDNHIVNYSKPELTQYCTFLSFFTTFFPVSSFFWTAFLAIYFVVILVLRKPNWSKKLLVLFNIVGWGVPFVICTVAASFHLLGPNNSRSTGGWCFVALQHYTNDSVTNYQLYLASVAVIAKGWEISSYFVVLVCYLIIIIAVKPHKFCKKGYQRVAGEPSFSAYSTTRNEAKYVRVSQTTPASLTSTQQSLLKLALIRIDWKIFLIPLVFIIFRFSGTFRYIISMKKECYSDPDDDHNCLVVSHDCYYLYGNFEPFIILQSFFDPLQGFGNAVLFVFGSRTIMKKVVGIFKNCFSYCRRKLHSRDYKADEFESQHNGDHPDMNGLDRRTLNDEREHLTRSPVNESLSYSVTY